MSIIDKIKKTFNCFEIKATRDKTRKYLVLDIHSFQLENKHLKDEKLELGSSLVIYDDENQLNWKTKYCFIEIDDTI